MELKSENISAPAGFEYWRLSAPGIPADSFVVRHSSFRDVLYHPETAGIALQDKMEKAGEAFCQSILDLALAPAASTPPVRRDELCELVFLSGGLFYHLNWGFKRQAGFSLPQSFLGIKREKVEGSKGDFRAVASYENFESMPDEAVLLIGDTIATGATLALGLEHAASALSREGKHLRRIVVVTLAGSLAGARRLEQTQKKLAIQHPGLATTFIAAEQLFHLMPDGTDLRFVGSDAVIPAPSAQYAKKEYGPWLSEHMKCAVFDWGTRCKNPLAHYEEFEKTARELLARHPDEKGKAALEERLALMEKEKSLYHGPLHLQ